MSRRRRRKKKNAPKFLSGRSAVGKPENCPHCGHVTPSISLFIDDTKVKFFCRHCFTVLGELSCNCGTTSFIIEERLEPHISNKDKIGKVRYAFCKGCSIFYGPLCNGPKAVKHSRSLNSSRWKRWHFKLNNELVCRFCKKKTINNKDAEFTVDHIKPLRLGGLDAFDNTRILCLDCHRKLNKQESVRSPVSLFYFYRKIRRLFKKIKKKIRFLLRKL